MAAAPLTAQDLVDLGWLPPVQAGHARAVVEVDLTGTRPDFLLHLTAPEGMTQAMFADGCAAALHEMAERARALETPEDTVAEAERILREH